MVNKFVKIKCADCGNEQITFAKAASPVKCNGCGKQLVKTTGGSAKFIDAEIVEEIE